MKRLTMAVLIGASLAATGCGNREQTADRTTAADVRKEVGEAADTTARFVEQERDQFVRHAQTELDRLAGELVQVKNRAESATGEARARLAAQAAAMEARWKEAESRLAELKTASAGTWQQAKANFSQQLDELKRSFEEEDRQERKQG